MKTIMCIFILFLSVDAWTEELYLQGVSVIGERKTAYIISTTISQTEKAKITVNEGETIGKWRVVKINPKFVLLNSELGEEKQLYLHSNVPIQNEEPQTTGNNLKDKKFTRSVIPDQDIPPGYHKIKTPFGDFLVRQKEEVSTTISMDSESTKSDSMEDMSTINNSGRFASVAPIEKEAGKVDLSPSSFEGYRKVKTPFGEFILKKTR